MQDMHVMSTVLGLGGRLVAGRDGGVSRYLATHVPPSLLSRDPYRTLLMRGGREGEIIERKNSLYTPGIIGSSNSCVGSGRFGSD